MLPERHGGSWVDSAGFSGQDGTRAGLEAACTPEPGGPWEVTVPYGVCLMAGWHCTTCRAAGLPALRAPYDNGGKIREAAAAHLRSTGHSVLFMRGTQELMVALATATKEHGDGQR